MSKIKNPLNARHLEHNAGQSRDIARRGGVPKRTNDGPVPHHPGMTPKQKGTAGIGGMAHAVIDGGQPGPLPHAYGSAADLKTGKAVAPTPGMRSRTNADCESHADKMQHGQDMMAQAVKN